MPGDMVRWESLQQSLGIRYRARILMQARVVLSESRKYLAHSVELRSEHVHLKPFAPFVGQPFCQPIHFFASAPTFYPSCCSEPLLINLATGWK
jgi:hypothetical protein